MGGGGGEGEGSGGTDEVRQINDGEHREAKGQLS